MINTQKGNELMFTFVCPYFKKYDNHIIRCEGIVNIPGVVSSQVVSFNSRNDRLNYINTFCSTFNYKKCPQAINLERKYENGNSTED